MGASISCVKKSKPASEVVSSPPYLYQAGVVCHPVESTVAHNQCSDALAPFGNRFLALMQDDRVVIYDPVTKSLVGRPSPPVSFCVYSMCADVETGLVALGGSAALGPDFLNLKVLSVSGVPTESGEAVAPGGLIWSEPPHSQGCFSSQVNSVRFGKSRMPMRMEDSGLPEDQPLQRILVVTLQDRKVEMFPVEKVSSLSPAETRPADPASQAPGWCVRMQGPAGPSHIIRRLRLNFRIPVNCAVPSPDGRWLAVGSDSAKVEVLGGDEGFFNPSVCKWRQELDFRKGLRSKGPRGTQYLAWSPDSEHLAATSDICNGVAVWRLSGPKRKGTMIRSACGSSSTSPPPNFKSIACLHSLPRPCLALHFAQDHQPPLLLWTQDRGAVHCLDVSTCSPEPVQLSAPFSQPTEPLTPSQGGGSLKDFKSSFLLKMFSPPSQQLVQTLTFGSVWTPTRINGLCCASGKAYIALPDRVEEFELLGEWSTDVHSRYPDRFKSAVRTILLASASSGLMNGSHNETNGQLDVLNGFQLLPKELTLQIVKHAAHPLSSWMKR